MTGIPAEGTTPRSNASSDANFAGSTLKDGTGAADDDTTTGEGDGAGGGGGGSTRF